MFQSWVIISIVFIHFFSPCCIGQGPIGILISAPQKDFSPSEDSKYWSTISNNLKIPIVIRRKAVFCLLQRHVRIGTNLSEISDILNIEYWLKIHNIIQIKSEALPFPVAPECLLNGSVFSFEVFRKKNPGGVVYFVFDKPISLEDFFRTITRQKTEKPIDPTLVQMYFWGYDFFVENVNSKEPPKL